MKFNFGCLKFCIFCLYELIVYIEFDKEFMFTQSKMK